MQMGSIRHFVSAGLIAICAAVSGCAYGPNDGDPVAAGDKIDWKGFATAPSSVILIQALRPSDNTWVQYDSVTSDSEDWNTENGRNTFDRQLYMWDKAGSVIPPWAFNGSGQATVRAVQGVSTQSPMWMFDAPGFQCLAQKFLTAYNAGTTMDTLDADQTCSRATNGGQDRNQVTVHR